MHKEGGIVDLSKTEFPNGENTPILGDQGVGYKVIRMKTYKNTQHTILKNIESK